MGLEQGVQLVGVEDVLEEDVVLLLVQLEVEHGRGDLHGVHQVGEGGSWKADTVNPVHSYSLLKIAVGNIITHSSFSFQNLGGVGISVAYLRLHKGILDSSGSSLTKVFSFQKLNSLLSLSN